MNTYTIKTYLFDELSKEAQNARFYGIKESYPGIYGIVNFARLSKCSKVFLKYPFIDGRYNQAIIRLILTDPIQTIM